MIKRFRISSVLSIKFIIFFPENIGHPVKCIMYTNLTELRIILKSFELFPSNSLLFLPDYLGQVTGGATFLVHVESPGVGRAAGQRRGVETAEQLRPGEKMMKNIKDWF